MTSFNFCLKKSLFLFYFLKNNFAEYRILTAPPFNFKYFILFCISIFSEEKPDMILAFFSPLASCYSFALSLFFIWLEDNVAG